MGNNKTLINILTKMKLHSIYKKDFNKLNKNEVRELIKIAEKLNSFDKNTAQYKINRLWLDCTDKPRHWVNICDLLGNAISIKFSD